MMYDKINPWSLEFECGCCKVDTSSTCEFNVLSQVRERGKGGRWVALHELLA